MIIIYHHRHLSVSKTKLLLGYSAEKISEPHFANDVEKVSNFKPPKYEADIVIFCGILNSRLFAGNTLVLMTVRSN